MYVEQVLKTWLVLSVFGYLTAGRLVGSKWTQKTGDKALQVPSSGNISMESGCK